MEGLTLQATRTFSPSQNSLTWRRRSILSSKPRASALRFEPATNRNANISLLSSAISLQSNFFGHRVSSRPRLPEPTRAVNKPTVAADKPASAPAAWQGAKPVPLAISLAIGIIVRFLVPKPVEVTPQAWQLLSIFLSTIAGLVLSPLPVGAWAFLGLTTAVITRTLSFSAAFSAFTNEVIWLIIISFFFARGFVKTGLGDRIAAYFVKWLGKSTLGLSYGLTVSEALIAPAMPSTTARAGGVFLPIIKSFSLSPEVVCPTTSRRRNSVLISFSRNSSHKKKRMKQLKNMMHRGLLDPEKDDPFSLFVTSTDIRYCYYAETEKILGNTYGMCVLQDFEALTPNLLARTIETVEGGGLVVLLLSSLSSLSNLYTMVMCWCKWYSINGTLLANVSFSLMETNAS